jgi:hypothetical protein
VLHDSVGDVPRTLPPERDQGAPARPRSVVALDLDVAHAADCFSSGSGGVAGQGERGCLHWGVREGTERDGEGGSRGGGDLEQQTGGRGCTCSRSVSWFGGGKGLPRVRGGWRGPENLQSCLRDNVAVHFGYNILYIKGIRSFREYGCEYPLQSQFLLLSCYRLALILRFLFLSFSFFGWSLDCWASPSFVLLARSRFGGPSKSSTATARKGREPERWRRRWRLGAHTDLNSASQIPNSRAASLSGRRRGVMPRRRRWRRPFDAPTTSSTRRALQAPPPPHPPLPPTRLA